MFGFLIFSICDVFNLPNVDNCYGICV